MGEGVVRESGMDRDTWLYLMDNHQGPAAERGDSAVLRGSWVGVWGRVDTCVCMGEFLCCPPEAITTFFVNHLSPSTK